MSTECDCVTKAQASLKPENRRLKTSGGLSMSLKRIVPGRPYLQTTKIVSGEKASNVPLVCSYCPFCGAKYPEA